MARLTKEIMTEYELSLRDEFAAKAMQALIQAYATEGKPSTNCLYEIVNEAYSTADMMLEVRRHF